MADTAVSGKRSRSIQLADGSFAGRSMDARANQPTADQQDGLPVPRRYWSAVAIWLALSMAVLDGSIANVALPTIGQEIGASAATSVWIVNAYQLTITVLLLPLAALGDRF